MWGPQGSPVLTAKKYTDTKVSAVDQHVYRPLNIKYEIDLTADKWTGSHGTLAQEGSDLKFTHSGDGTHYAVMSCDLSASPIDISDCHVAVEIEILEGSGGSAFAAIDLIMWVLTDVKNVSPYWNLIWGSDSIMYAGDMVSDCIPALDDGGLSPTVDYTQIKTIQLRLGVESPYTATPSIVVKRIVFYRKPTSKGLVVCGFDGGWADQVNAANYLQSLGLKGTLFVSGTFTGAADRLTLAHLQALQAKGHLICNYPWTATSGYWYENTIAGKIAAVEENAAWLEANGFGDGKRYVSTPGGGFAAGEEVLWDNDHVRLITGRVHVASAPRPSSFYTYPCPHAVGPSDTNTRRTAAIDATAAHNAVCIFIFHQCAGKAQDISFADFQTIANYIKTKRDAGLIDVVTPDEIPRYIVQARAWPPH